MKFYKIGLVLLITSAFSAFCAAALVNKQSSSYVVHGTRGYVYYKDEFGQLQPVKLLQELKGDSYIVVGKVSDSPIKKDIDGYVLMTHEGDKIYIGPFYEGPISDYKED